MVHVRISSHAELQALESRSDRTMVVDLRSLESLHIASDSYELLLCNLIQRSYWTCPQMDLLSLVASVVLELHKIKHDLLPPLAQNATPGGGFLKALLLLRNSAAALLCLAKDAKEKVEGSLVEKDVLLEEVEDLGVRVEDAVRLVLDGSRKYAWIEALVPDWLNSVNVLLSTPVHFPDRVSAVSCNLVSVLSTPVHFPDLK